MGHTDVSGYDLHAFVDGELGAGGRRRWVIARLAADPGAAGRVAAYARQRAVLAALGKALVLAPPPAPLGELARALRRATARLAAGRPESVALHRLPAPDEKRATRRR